jgi:hypothetical protein
MRVSELRVGVLTYFVGTEHVYATLLDQTGVVRPYRLMRWARAYPLIDEFLEATKPNASVSRSSSVFERFSAEWGRELVPPAEDFARFDVLEIIPHHTLHGLPLHVIQPAGGASFLATTHGIAYCSSGHLFVRCVGRNVVRKSAPCAWQFATGEDDGPVTAPEPPRSCNGSAVDVVGDATARFLSLADTFARHFPEPFTDSIWPANRNMLKTYMNQPKRSDVICVVCHGYLDPVSADDSGLLVGRLPGLGKRPLFEHSGLYYLIRDRPFRHVPAEIEPRQETELLTIRELTVDSRSDAELVALFACHTGAGQLVSSDDFSSMAYQWLKIGAASVLANLWELDLQIAETWSSLFLDNWLKRRQPKAIAWMHANQQLLAREPGMNPYHWGVITLLGDWL